MSKPVSIVIPAHNEATVIGRALALLLRGAEPGEFDVVVACNGCTDDTAEVARGFGGDVRVVEIEAASKVAALNTGDRLARHFPRLYVDADVQLDTGTARATADSLRSPRVMAASPGLRVDVSRSSWPVRCFYRVWLTRPYHRHGRVGAGVYGLSEAGRRRFDEFPDLIADDHFVWSQFGPEERVGLEHHHFTIVAPSGLWGLIRVKTRSRLGRLQLWGRYPALRRSGGADSPVEPSHDRRARWGVSAWVSAPVYVAVQLVVRWRARVQYARRRIDRWERDASSRRAWS